MTSCACILALSLATMADPKPVAEPLAVVSSGKGGRAYYSAYFCAAFLDGGKTVVFGGGNPLGPGRLVFWDVAARKVTKECNEHEWAIKSIAVSPDGSMIATGGGYGEVKVYDTSGKVLHHLDGRTNYTYGIAFSPDGSLLANTGERLTVRDTTKFEILKEFDKPEETFGATVDFSPDGAVLLGVDARTGGKGGFRYFSTGGWASTHMSEKGTIYSRSYVRYAPSGDSLVVLRRSEHVKDRARTEPATEVWSVVKGAPEKPRWAVDGEHLGMTFTADSKLVLLGESEPSGKGEVYRIHAHDTATGKEVTSWVQPNSSTIRHLCISPDGKLLVACDDKSAKVWDLEQMLGKHWSAPPKATADRVEADEKKLKAKSPEKK